ncbi:mannan endo-1,4-beta-mannosidase 6-like [Rhododendron vialii]|uniref:mannan endo-1,4-beta-mannosidase 6-like n=1 Tax=Rhododendron vialii TaxID=182163 RepID=UPI00265DB00A|nr:mannan endo-1,4-beta-mannosidase 6-like [Rhododendron vialii]
MDTLGKKFGFKGIFRVDILVFFTVNLSYNVLVVNGDEIIEPVVGKLDNPLAYSIINHGIYEEGEMEDGAWTMVQTKGNQFVVYGQAFYVNGFNTYWLMEFAVEQSTRGKVNEVFQQVSAVGLTVCRTWAFNDGQGQALQKSASVYDDEVFQALDFVVIEAKKYKIRLILTLTNYWDGFGGKPQYVKWGKAAGLNLTSDGDFFTHVTIKSYYKANLKTVLNRVNTLTNITYKDDPTNLGWFPLSSRIL